MTLTDLIAKAINLKDGDKEFRLAYAGYENEQFSWEAEIGNRSLYVALGEASGEYVAHGETPEAAVAALIEQLETA